LPVGYLVTESPHHPTATYWVQHTINCITQFNTLEDGQNCCPKYVVLIWIYQSTVIVASSWPSSLPSLIKHTFISV